MNESGHFQNVWRQVPRLAHVADKLRWLEVVLCLLCFISVSSCFSKLSDIVEGIEEVDEALNRMYSKTSL